VYGRRTPSCVRGARHARAAPPRRLAYGCVRPPHSLLRRRSRATRSRSCGARRGDSRRARSPVRRPVARDTQRYRSAIAATISRLPVGVACAAQPRVRRNRVCGATTCAAQPRVCGATACAPAAHAGPRGPARRWRPCSALVGRHGALNARIVRRVRVARSGSAQRRRRTSRDRLDFRDPLGPAGGPAADWQRASQGACGRIVRGTSAPVRGPAAEPSEGGA
jgi:hypothetical protein